MRERVIWGVTAGWAVLAALQMLRTSPMFWVFVFGCTALYSAASARRVMSRPAAIGWSVFTLCIATAMFATLPNAPMGWGALFDVAAIASVGLWSGFLAWRADAVGAIGDPKA